MSAYIVTKSHILFLVLAAMRGSSRFGGSAFRYYHNNDCHALPPGDWAAGAAAATMLWGENITSVGHRYPKGSSVELPGPVGENFSIGAADVARAAARFQRFTPAQIFKSLHCYEYQSCEHDGWEASEAHAFCQALAGQAARSVPGYEDAVWGAPELKVD